MLIVWAYFICIAIVNVIAIVCDFDVIDQI